MPSIALTRTSVAQRHAPEKNWQVWCTNQFTLYEHDSKSFRWGAVDHYATEELAFQAAIEWVKVARATFEALDGDNVD